MSVNTLMMHVLSVHAGRGSSQIFRSAVRSARIRIPHNPCARVRPVACAHAIQQITAPVIMGRNRRSRRAREVTDAMEAVAKVCVMDAGCKKPGCSACAAHRTRELKTADKGWCDCKDVFEYVERVLPYEQGILRHARMMMLEGKDTLFRCLCAAVAANKRQLLHQIALLALDQKKENMACIAIQLLPLPSADRAARTSTEDLAIRCMKASLMRAFEEIVILYTKSDRTGLMCARIVTKAFVTAMDDPLLYGPLLWIIRTYGGHVSVLLHLNCYRRLCALDGAPRIDLVLYTRLLAEDPRFRDHCEFIHTVVRDASAACVKALMSFGTITVATQLMAVRCVKRNDPECQKKLEAIVEYRNLVYDPDGPIPAEAHDAIVNDDAARLERCIPACETSCPELARAVSHVISLCVMRPSQACLRALIARVGCHGMLSMMLMTSAVPLIDLGLIEQLRVITEILPALASKPNSAGRLPLHAACASKFAHAYEMVAVLLENGADPNAREACGDTALHVAAFVSDVPMVDLLVRHGADVGAQDNIGATPLHDAVRLGNEPVVRRLLALGAPTHLLATGREGNTWSPEALAYHMFAMPPERTKASKSQSKEEKNQCHVAERIWLAIAKRVIVVNGRQDVRIVPNIRDPFSTCGRFKHTSHRASGAA